MKAQNIMTLLLMLISFTACNKDKVTSSKLAGTYNGKLVVNNEPTAKSIRMTISAKTYETKLDGLSIPYGRGTYITKNNEVIFTDTIGHIIFFETDRTWLDGTYTPTIKDDSLILVEKGKESVYSYRLKKQ